VTKTAQVELKSGRVLAPAEIPTHRVCIHTSHLGPPDIARRVIQRTLNPGLLSERASYDMEGNILQTLVLRGV